VRKTAQRQTAAQQPARRPGFTPETDRVEGRRICSYDPRSGTVESGGTENIAMWMLDTDYVRKNRTFALKEGRRSPGYIVASEASRTFGDPGVFIELPLVNQIRTRLKNASLSRQKNVYIQRK